MKGGVEKSMLHQDLGSQEGVGCVVTPAAF